MNFYQKRVNNVLNNCPKNILKYLIIKALEKSIANENVHEDER